MQRAQRRELGNAIHECGLVNIPDVLTDVLVQEKVHLVPHILPVRRIRVVHVHDALFSLVTSDVTAGALIEMAEHFLRGLREVLAPLVELGEVCDVHEVVGLDNLHHPRTKLETMKLILSHSLCAPFRKRITNKAHDGAYKVELQRTRTQIVVVPGSRWDA